MFSMTSYANHQQSAQRKLLPLHLKSTQTLHFLTSQTVLGFSGHTVRNIKEVMLMAAQKSFLDRALVRGECLFRLGYLI